jgi:uncharacterized protein
MSTRESPWPDATPSWIDLSSGDIEASRRFYQALFGWTIKDGPEDYADCYLDGLPVCGMVAGRDAARPHGWITYFAASALTEVLDRVRRAGGRVQVGPTRTGERGSWALAADPQGAVFGLWQAGSHSGAQRVNEAGALVWNEHLSRDYLLPQPFYAAVLGWRYHDISEGDFRYATFLAADGREVGGIGQPPPQVSTLVNHWLVYFAAEDADATVSRTVRLGGGVLLPAMDTPHGRLAVVHDDQDAVFALISAA